ncbi:MAG: hypothetical protein IGBAC_1734 [Ignavibacteriae bacterium]|nr:MAG: hypothetical protein IGBAC_1734 [Ignavibacteriota bacterium]
MKQVKITVLLWLSNLMLFGFAYIIYKPELPSFIVILGNIVQLLLFYLSLMIFISEPTIKNRFVFLNFSLFFSNVFLQLVYNFGLYHLFLKSKYASVFAYQYFYIFFQMTLAFAIVYLVVDFLFRNIGVLKKYLIAFAIIFTLGTYYFINFFTSPDYLYNTENISYYKAVSKAIEDYRAENNREPLPNEILDKVELNILKDNLNVGILNKEAKLAKIKNIMLYIESNSWIVLLYQPLHYNLLYMNVFILLFIFLYFGYQYAKDPPQGAYIDKIMYVMLFIVSLDSLHQWAFIKNVEYSEYMSLFDIGQYFSIAAYGGLVIFFYARLKFIKSVVGEFYEVELQTNPEGITRWIDGIDRFILNHFTNPRDLKGRLFEQRAKQ